MSKKTKTNAALALAPGNAAKGLIRRRLKPRSNKIFLQMSPMQREKVLDWLFEKNLAIKAVAEKCKTQFKIQLSISTVRAIYRDEAEKRNFVRILKSSEFARQLARAFGKNSETMYQALLATLAQMAFEAALALERGERPDLGPLMRALPLLMDARKDAREDKKLELERERWEFDAVRMCHDHFKQLQAIIADKSLDEPERLQGIRKELFGDIKT